MGCSCKHNREAIEEGKRVLGEFRELFLKRLTVDSETHDARRKDFNQAIYHYREDGSTYCVWNDTDLEMIMGKFDKAVRDWRDSFCDVENCKRKR